jgi:N-methylhydantoinase A
VCYGRGGTRPTVTDANLVLGLIDPEFFLGGEMQLDSDGARAAIGEVADALGVDVMQAAEGIVAVTNARMADALRSLTIQRGHDPREFSLLVYGGAGPLHGAALAADLEISEVIVPLGTGVFSAWGMLHAAVRHDVSLPLHLAVEGLTDDTLADRFGTLQERGRALLERDGVPAAEAQVAASADMRYVGQEYFVNVDGEFSFAPGEWERAFHRTYRRIHGHALPDSPVEVVNLRVTARGRELAIADAGERPAPPADRPGERSIFIGGGFVTARVVQRHALAEPLPGPAIIEEAGSTTLVPPLWEALPGPQEAIVMRRIP